MENYLNKAVNDIKSFLEANKLPIPSTAIEYDALVSKMRAYHRATLCNNGVSATRDIIPKLLEGTVLKPSAMYSQLESYCQAHGIAFEIDNVPNKVVRRNIAKLTCQSCGYTESTTIASVIRRTGGCKKCEHKLPVNTYKEDFKALISIKGFSLVESTERITTESSVQLKCNSCGTVTTRTVAHCLYRHSLCCSKCNPAPIYGKLGTPTEYNGLEFDSTIELESFKLLEGSGIPSLIRPTYKQLGIDGCLFEADFLVDNLYVLEISSFNKHHVDYHSRIKLKQALIESRTEFTFIFCNSLADVKDFISTYKFIVKI